MLTSSKWFWNIDRKLSLITFIFSHSFKVIQFYIKKYCAIESLWCHEAMSYFIKVFLQYEIFSLGLAFFFYSFKEYKMKVIGIVFMVGKFYGTKSHAVICSSIRISKKVLDRVPKFNLTKTIKTNYVEVFRITQFSTFES